MRRNLFWVLIFFTLVNSEKSLAQSGKATDPVDPGSPWGAPTDPSDPYNWMDPGSSSYGYGDYGDYGGGRKDPIVTVDRIVNLGYKIWRLVEANKPVVNNTGAFANGVPEGIAHWSNLESWDVPQAKDYRVTYTNGFGGKVVDFKFQLLYTVGGSYGGAGKYLADVTIIPSDLSVAWGYKFSSTVSVVSVLNTGTKEDPVAGISLMLKWSVDTALKHMERTSTFFIRGDSTVVNTSGDLGKIRIE